VWEEGTPMLLNPKHVTLQGLLIDRLFRIPDYQRAYAWETKQRLELFGDIREAQRSGLQHFMATIVCLAKESRRIGADVYQSVEVVDGQQRLTSLIILFKAIEKALDKDNAAESKVKREISDLLVKGDDHSLVLLQTNHDSSNIFTTYLKAGTRGSVEAKTKADVNLIDATKESETFVRAWSENKSLIDLVALLRNNISFIYHELTDEATVYRVFEVLNSRGLDVRWIDKLKSQLMGRIFSQKESGARAESLHEMHVIWQDIYRVLGLRGDLGDEALRFAGTFRAGSQTNRLLSQEDATSVLVECAGSKLKTISEVGLWVKAVVEAVNSVDRNVRLRAVTRIVHARFVAVAIMLRAFPTQIEGRLLREWERVTFRVFGLGGADTRNKVGDYVRLGYDIIAGNVGPNKISTRLKDIGSGYSITEVLEEIEWDESYDGWAEELRYLLFRYDEYLAAEAGEKINATQWQKIWEVDPSKSIEHVQPQSSERSYVHHLGNLTMLPPGVNSSLKDKPPAEKASAYKSCGIRATMALGEKLEKVQWDKDEVLKRAAMIEKFVKSEWAD
jgi:hypothetical protein